MMNVLVVGAGFSGLVHARELAEAGFKVTVIDRRNHVAGNCYDYVNGDGLRIHKYGPHIFHTSNDRVVAWLSRFTGWLPYDHKVVSQLPDKRLVPNPINLDTINATFNIALEHPGEVEAFLKRQAMPIDPIASAEDHLHATIGPTLTDLFFRPYSRKMWAMDLRDISADVVRRLQIRSDRDGRYFLNDSFQAMPSDGYTALFEKAFDHANIAVRLETPFEKGMMKDYDYCFNSMPIDEYFDFSLGDLPYRSIKFHMSSMDISESGNHAVVNYTDASPYTRETWWHLLPGHHLSGDRTVTRTIEEPCDYRDNDFERYYPVKTKGGLHDITYRNYRDIADQSGTIEFIGRCGTYQYLDMHQVINQSIANARKWIRRSVQ